jgi:hypothetical protein
MCILFWLKLERPRTLFGPNTLVTAFVRAVAPGMFRWYRAGGEWYWYCNKSNEYWATFCCKYPTNRWRIWYYDSDQGSWHYQVRAWVKPVPGYPTLPTITLSKWRCWIEATPYQGDRAEQGPEDWPTTSLSHRPVSADAQPMNSMDEGVTWGFMIADPNDSEDTYHKKIRWQVRARRVRRRWFRFMRRSYDHEDEEEVDWTEGGEAWMRMKEMRMRLGIWPDCDGKMMKSDINL